MNKQLLMSCIVRYDKTQGALAKEMGLSLSRLNAKINEKSAQFNQDEIAFIKDRYNLSDKQVVEIFFNKQIS